MQIYTRLVGGFNRTEFHRSFIPRGGCLDFYLASFASGLNDNTGFSSSLLASRKLMITIRRKSHRTERCLLNSFYTNFLAVAQYMCLIPKKLKLISVASSNIDEWIWMNNNMAAYVLFRKFPASPRNCFNYVSILRISMLNNIITI